MDYVGESGEVVVGVYGVVTGYSAGGAAADMAVVPDTGVFPVAQKLLDCFCAELANTLGGAPCKCCLVFGDSVPWDSCEEGQAWVRVVRVFPSTILPDQDTSVSTCVTTWAAEFELGIIRCACNPDDDGVLPGCDCELDRTQKALSDAAAIRRVLDCCFVDLDIYHVPGEYLPVGPAGGCVGAIQGVIVNVPADQTVTA